MRKKTGIKSFKKRVPSKPFFKIQLNTQGVKTIKRWLFATGITLVIVASAIKILNGNNLAFKNQTGVGYLNEKTIPVIIDIDYLNIHLPIEPALVDNNQWEVSQNGVSYLANSAGVGEPANLVLYAHNKRNRFGSLPWIKIGTEIILTDSNGFKYSYTVNSTRTVKPDETSVIIPHGYEELTLYTCTGLLDSKRFIVTALPKK